MGKDNNIKRPLPHNLIVHFIFGLYRDSMRQLNPDKSDEELGIDKPFFNEVCSDGATDLFYKITHLFKK